MLPTFTNRRGRVLAAGVASAVVVVSLTAPAIGSGADSTGVGDRATVRAVTVNDRVDAPGFEASLSLKFDEPVSKQRADRIRMRLSSKMVAARGSSAKKKWKRMHCNKHYMWRDENGTMNMQRECGNKHLQWGFDLAPPLVAIVVGNVHETGLDWWRNGEDMPKNAPHVEDPMYRFHGTMTGAHKGDKIRYEDHYKFRHNVGSGGDADLEIRGKLKMKGKKKK